jgi:hypothetical protein
MRYIVGVGAIGILVFVAWLLPPGGASPEPLLADGFLSFVAGWTLALIPLGFTVAILAGAWLAFSSGMAKMAKAQHPKVPKSVSSSYSPHYRGLPPAPALPAPPVVDVTPTDTLPTAPSYAALRAQGWQPQIDRLLLGYSATGPIYGSIEKLLSTGIAGRPDQGKSTMQRFVYVQSLACGSDVAILDPHGSILDAIPGAPARVVASTAHEFDDAAAWLRGELEPRLHAYRQGVRTFTPLLILCDEWPVISLASSAAIAAISRVVLEGRKVKLYALISGQGLPASNFGGRLVRDALSTRYVFHTTPAEAQRAGLDREAAQLVKQLQPGCAVLEGPTVATTVAIPNTTAADVASVHAGSALVVEHITPLPAHSIALNPRAERVRQMLREKRSQSEIFADVWKVTAKGGRDWQRAAEEYRQIVAELVQ